MHLLFYDINVKSRYYVMPRLLYSLTSCITLITCLSTVVFKPGISTIEYCIPFLFALISFRTPFGGTCCRSVIVAICRLSHIVNWK